MAGAAGLSLLFVVVSVQKIWGADTWWQLATGRWVVEHWRVPAVDHLSYTVAGREWIELRWVFCVLLYLGWQVGGAAMLIAGQVLMLAAVWGVTVWPVRGVMRSPAGAVVIGVVGLGLVAGMGRWVLRPELTTYVMVAVFLSVLGSETASQRDSESGGRRTALRWLWLLPVLQVVWVNAHTLAVMGPVLCWMFVGAGVVEHIAKLPKGQMAKLMWGRAGRLVWAAALVSVACLVNPYFVRGAMFPLLLWKEIQGGHVVSANIGEMKSPLAMPLSQWTWDLYAAAGLLVIGIASFAVRWRRVNLARLLVFAAGVYLACKAQRNAGLFAVMGSWAVLRNIAESAPAMEGGVWRRAAAVGNVMIGAVLGFLGWYIATDRYQIAVGAPREFGVGVVEWNTPRGAVEFLKESGAKGPVFNLIRDGGYLAWALPRMPVYVDGRLEVYREEFLTEAFGIRGENWARVAERRGFNTAVVPVDGYEDIVGAIAKLPGWALVYVDHRDCVFVREVAEHQALIGKYKIELAREWKREGAEPEERLPAWKAAYGGRGRPWYSMGMAQSFFALGSLENAAVYLRRALEHYPGHERAMAELAAVDAFLGRREEADQLARKLKPAWAVYSDRMLAGWLMGAGRKDEAMAVLERAVRGGTHDATLRVALADLYFQANPPNFAAAKAEYERAAADGMDGAAEWMKLGYACEKTGDKKGAEAAYRKSLARDERQHQVWYLLAGVLAGQGDKAGARAALEKCLAIKPDFEPAKRAVGK